MLEHHRCKRIPFHEGLIEFCLLVSTRRLLMHVSKSVTEPHLQSLHNVLEITILATVDLVDPPCLATNRARVEVSSCFIRQVDVTVSEANL